jgi:phospholipid/cholesterol/gamma-HCH transport system permease protein
MLALLLMMPLLVVYADFMGMAGGWIVGVGMLKLTSTAYINESRNGVELLDFGLGVFKGAVFGAIVALAGCLRGMQAGRSSAAVGDAATSAVVTGIVFIIVTDAIFAILTNILGI